MKESFVAIFILTLITAAGLYIRFDAAAEPIWLDECHTAWAVDTDSASEVAARAADGNQPPRKDSGSVSFHCGSSPSFLRQG